MSKTRAFVMGHPIAHSRSPMLHGYWLKKHGIVGSYEKIDVAPEDIPAFFAGYRDAGWVGGNVTVPHKLAVIPFLDRVDNAVDKMGAVNAIWWEGDTLVGGNTDWLGLMGNIDDRVPGWDKDAKRVVVLGAGGASRAAIYGFLSRGLEVAICNRTVEKAEALAEHFGASASAYGMDALAGLLADADVLVNTTSLGMVGQPPNDVDLLPMKPEAVVYDIVYVPLETGLLKAAKARGLRTVDGLGMLLHQGVYGFEHWFGIRPKVTDELRQLIVDDIRAKTPEA